MPINSFVGNYVTPTTEPEPTLEALYYRIELTNGNGWIPEDSEDWVILHPIEGNVTNTVEWEMEEE